MISIPDNSIKKNFSQIGGATTNDLKNLLSISGKTISELQNKNPNLLIFPPYLQDAEDKIGDEKILTIENATVSFDNEKCDVTITTGNLMGFIGIGGTKLKIYSRFDSGTQNNKNGQDYFLHYMLQKIFHLNFSFEYCGF